MVRVRSSFALRLSLHDFRPNGRPTTSPSTPTIAVTISVHFGMSRGRRGDGDGDGDGDEGSGVGGAVIQLPSSLARRRINQTQSTGLRGWARRFASRGRYLTTGSLGRLDRLVKAPPKGVRPIVHGQVVSWIYADAIRLIGLCAPPHTLKREHPAARSGWRVVSHYCDSRGSMNTPARHDFVDLHRHRGAGRPRNSRPCPAATTLRSRAASVAARCTRRSDQSSRRAAADAT